MQQRAELARALMVKPEILYLDEPFGALDALTRLRMRAELLRILSRERHTVLLVTHDVEEALHLADRILVLSPRPARIQRMIEVTLPRPRVLSDPELLALKASILTRARGGRAGGPGPMIARRALSLRSSSPLAASSAAGFAGPGGARGKRRAPERRVRSAAPGAGLRAAHRPAGASSG